MIAVWWGRGLGTVSAEVSLALAIEALAFIHEASTFVCCHTTGASMAQCGVHGVGVSLSSFTVKPLAPLVQVLLFQRGLVLLIVIDS